MDRETNKYHTTRSVPREEISPGKQLHQKMLLCAAGVDQGPSVPPRPIHLSPLLVHSINPRVKKDTENKGKGHPPPCWPYPATQRTNPSMATEEDSSLSIFPRQSSPALRDLAIGHPRPSSANPCRSCSPVPMRWLWRAPEVSFAGIFCHENYIPFTFIPAD